jgi:hypothetical protein
MLNGLREKPQLVPEPFVTLHRTNKLEKGQTTGRAGSRKNEGISLYIACQRQKRSYIPREIKISEPSIGIKYSIKTK